MSKQIIEAATSAMQEIKANNITVMDLTELDNAICQTFIICHGTSNTHVSSIAQLVEKELKENLEEIPFRKEGYRNAEWILLDYSSVVIHVFQEHIREFYNIEDLWADAKTTVLKEN